MLHGAYCITECVLPDAQAAKLDGNWISTVFTDTQGEFLVTSAIPLEGADIRVLMGDTANDEFFVSPLDPMHSETASSVDYLQPISCKAAFTEFYRQCQAHRTLIAAANSNYLSPLSSNLP